MMESIRMVTSESGSCGSGGWCRCSAKWWMGGGGGGAVLRAAAWSREWGQTRRPRLMQVDLLINDTLSWLYTWSLVLHKQPCRCRVAGMVPRDWSW